MFLSLVNLPKSPMRPPDTRHSLIVRLKDSRNDLAWTEFVDYVPSSANHRDELPGKPKSHVDRSLTLRRNWACVLAVPTCLAVISLLEFAQCLRRC